MGRIILTAVKVSTAVFLDFPKSDLGASANKL